MLALRKALGRAFFFDPFQKKRKKNRIVIKKEYICKVFDRLKTPSQRNKRNNLLFTRSDDQNQNT